MKAYHSGGSVVVEISDDGRGLDRDKIIEKAIAKGLINSGAGVSDSELIHLIFQPGFSTADKVTDISGRGVGLDVVRKAVEILRGRVDVSSEPGRGCTFSVRLPLTMAITDGMLIKVGNQRYILPMVNINMSFRPEAGALSTVVGRGEIVIFQGKIMPIIRLHRLFDIRGAVEDPAQGLLIIIGDGDQCCALLVDELVEQQQVVAKSLGAGIGKIRGISGGAILGDGRVGLILDPQGIVALARQASNPVSAKGMESGKMTRNNRRTNTTMAKAGQDAQGSNRVRPLREENILTFLMANEKYGLEILKVREIIGMMDITAVPTIPAYVRGVINLRGKVIPVIDLRLKFGMEAKEDGQRTCIIVVNLARTAQELTMGIIVDEVADVINIGQSQMEPPPSFGANIRTDFILGMGKVDHRVMTLLDIDRVLSGEEIAILDKATQIKD